MNPKVKISTHHLSTETQIIPLSSANHQQQDILQSQTSPSSTNQHLISANGQDQSECLFQKKQNTKMFTSLQSHNPESAQKHLSDVYDSQFFSQKQPGCNSQNGTQNLLRSQGIQLNYSDQLIYLEIPFQSLLSKKLKPKESMAREQQFRKSQKLNPTEMKFLSWTAQFLSQVGMKKTAQTILSESYKKGQNLPRLSHSNKPGNFEYNQQKIGQELNNEQENQEINQIKDKNSSIEEPTTKETNISEQEFLRKISEMQSSDEMFSFCESVVDANQTRGGNHLSKTQLSDNQSRKDLQASLKSKDNIISDIFCHYFSSTTKTILPIHQTLLYQSSSPITHISYFNSIGKTIITKSNSNKQDQPMDLQNEQTEQKIDREKTKIPIVHMIACDSKSHLYHFDIHGVTFKEDKHSMRGLKQKRDKIITLAQIFSGKYFVAVLQKGLMKIFSTNFNQKNQSQSYHDSKHQTQNFRAIDEFNRSTSRRVFNSRQTSGLFEEEKTSSKKNQNKFKYLEVVSLLITKDSENKKPKSESSKDYIISCAQVNHLEVSFGQENIPKPTYLQLAYQLSPEDEPNAGGPIVIKVIKINEVETSLNLDFGVRSQRQRRTKRRQTLVKLNVQLVFEVIIPNPHQVKYSRLYLFQFKNASLIHSLIQSRQKFQTKIPNKKLSMDSDNQSIHSLSDQQQKYMTRNKHYSSQMEQNYRLQKIQKKREKNLEKYLRTRSQFFSTNLIRKDHNPAMQDYVDRFLTKYGVISGRQEKKSVEINFFNEFINENFKIIGHSKESNESECQKKEKKISLLDLNGDVGNLYMCKDNEYINSYKVVRQSDNENGQTEKTNNHGQSISCGLKQYIYVFITGFEVEKGKKNKQNTINKSVSYRKLIKINFLGAVVDDFPIFEYLSHEGQEDQLMVDLTIERGFVDFKGESQTQFKSKTNQHYKKAILNHLEADSAQLITKRDINPPSGLNSNKVTDFIIYQKPKLIVISTSRSIIYYSMARKKILLSVDVDKSVTKFPISKLVQLDDSLSQIGFVRGQFLQILDVQNNKMVKKYRNKNSLKSMFGIMLNGLPRSYLGLLRQLAREHPEIFSMRLS